MGHNDGNKSTGLQMQLETISPACLRLIQDLANTPFNGDFYLVGGTALALQIGHRTSIDLDFFTTKEFDPASWRAKLEQLGKITKLTAKPNNLISTVNGVKLEYLYFAYPPRFPLIEWEGIKMMDARDIGLFKILAILGRNRKKDIIDLYFIDKLVMPLEQVIETFVNLYDEGDINLLKQVEVLFDDYQVEKSSMPIMLKSFDWGVAYPEVKTKLLKAISDLVIGKD